MNPNQAPLTTQKRFLYVTPFIARTDGILAAPTLLTSGSGYTKPFVSGTLTGGGVGGNVVLNINTGTGQAEGMFVASRGSGYTNPTVTFPTPAGGSPATAVIYANQSQSILGNTGEENKLISFCQTQNINALILYELNFMDWSNNGLGTVTAPGKLMLKNFIDKAKLNGVEHISAARGWDSYISGQTQVNQIRDYNLWCESNNFLSGSFNSITTEVEWWQASPESDKYEVQGVLGYANQQLRNPETTQLNTPLEINIYLGKGPNYSSTDPQLYVNYTDRWLVATYVSSSNTGEDWGLYTYTRGDESLHRMLDIANAYNGTSRQAKILPIFSAESKLNPWNRNGGFNGVNYNTVDPNSSEDFMGTKFSSAIPFNFSLQQAYENWARQLNAGYPQNAVWDTETNSTIYTNLVPEGIALFESRLLMFSNPVEQNTPTPPFIPQSTEPTSAYSELESDRANKRAANKKVGKPIPKTQREISREWQEPYDKAMGNPNDAKTTNRGQDVSFKGDTTKPFSLGIEDIDQSVMYYIDNVIKPFVIQNGERLPIPVIYGNPEKWKAVQADGYYRDKNGKIMCPLIMFKRDSLDKVRTIGNKLDANSPNLYQISTKKYSSKNAYSNFDVINNRIPVKENYVIVVPDYVTLTYSCTIMTYYIEQMNKVIEAMNYASDSYWGDPERFKFRAMIDSIATVTEVPTSGTDRVSKSTFTIRLNGYLIPDVIQKDLLATKKLLSKSQIIILTETTSNL
jgi:hypothetical protein